MSADADVVVVGGGLAGLQCARDLEAGGLRVTLLEAGERVGGRVQSESIDGFTVDVGFQVLNPAYPAVRRLIDLPRLGLQPFAAGVGVRKEDRLRILADPRRHPRYLLQTLRSGYLNPLALAAAARWAGPGLAFPVRVKRAGGDLALSEALDRAGFTQPLRTDVVDAFLAGVLVDSTGSSSSAFAKLLVRMFALGRPGLPARGMNALPRQIAEGVSDIRLGVRAQEIDRSGEDAVVRTDGDTVRARAVVVATDPVQASRLTAVPAPRMKGLVTWWFAAEHAPSDLPMLLVDAGYGRAAGPVVNTAVISNAAPSYAPAGRHLIQATTLLDRPDGDAGEAAVRSHLASIYGASSQPWQLVARHRIPEALPAQPPPLSLRREVRIADGLFVCGDHRDTASIQGALVSGQRTARAVLRELGQPAAPVSRSV